MNVREDWITDNRYTGPRKTHDGPCCGSCIDDYNDGSFQPDDYFCCCIELNYAPDIDERSAASSQAAWRARGKT